jgi:hypothetical protein
MVDFHNQSARPSASLPAAPGNIGRTTIFVSGLNIMLFFAAAGIR